MVSKSFPEEASISVFSMFYHQVPHLDIFNYYGCCTPTLPHNQQVEDTKLKQEKKMLAYHQHEKNIQVMQQRSMCLLLNSVDLPVHISWQPLHFVHFLTNMAPLMVCVCVCMCVYVCVCVCMCVCVCVCRSTFTK